MKYPKKYYTYLNIFKINVRYLGYIIYYTQFFLLHIRKRKFFNCSHSKLFWLFINIFPVLVRKVFLNKAIIIRNIYCWNNIFVYNIETSSTCSIKGKKDFTGTLCNKISWNVLWEDNRAGLVGNTVDTIPSSNVSEVEFVCILPVIILQLEDHLQNGNVTRTPKQINLITFSSYINESVPILEMQTIMNYVYLKIRHFEYQGIANNEYMDIQWTYYKTCPIPYEII